MKWKKGMHLFWCADSARAAHTQWRWQKQSKLKIKSFIQYIFRKVPKPHRAHRNAHENVQKKRSTSYTLRMQRIQLHCHLCESIFQGKRNKKQKKIFLIICGYTTSVDCKIDRRAATACVRIHLINILFFFHSIKKNKRDADMGFGEMRIGCVRFDVVI